MKTKEFIKLIEGADFTVEDSGDYLYVSKVNHSGYTSGLYGRVSKKHEYCFDTNYITFAKIFDCIRVWHNILPRRVSIVDNEIS